MLTLADVMSWTQQHPLVTLAIVIYVAWHIICSTGHYRHYRHRSFLSRCRLSIPGPFHTRISRNL